MSRYVRAQKTVAVPILKTLKKNGGAGNRTPDIGLMRPPLYQLSYAAVTKVNNHIYSLALHVSSKPR